MTMPPTTDDLVRAVRKRAVTVLEDWLEHGSIEKQSPQSDGQLWLLLRLDQLAVERGVDRKGALLLAFAGVEITV